MEHETLWDARSLDERLSGQVAESAAAQAAVVTQVAALAETTTTFDEKIVIFVRSLRGDFRATKDELLVLMDEKVQLAVEDGRASNAEIVARQNVERGMIDERLSSLSR
jgi:hypothetical protein